MNESTLVPREEISDLDWLARNVHVWVPNELLRMKPCDNGNGTFRASWCYSGDGGFTKDQWLARRAELQNKPGWSEFRESANYMAQDSDGAWRAFECEPTPSSHIWNARHGWRGYANIDDLKSPKGEILGDWRDTLEKRPEQAKFEPFVSVEDAATARQHDPVNSPSHYASGGIECIDAIKASMSHEAFLGYLKGNVQKYMWRYEKKVNPSEDLKKARWYLDKLIEGQK